MWTDIIKGKVLVRLNAELLKKYSNITITNTDRVSTKAKFPTVYVKKLQGSMVGDDCEGYSVNGILSDFQIEVMHNTSQNEAEQIAYAIWNIMVEKLGYKPIGEPYPDNTDSVYRVVTRYRRTIAKNDILNW